MGLLWEMTAGSAQCTMVLEMSRERRPLPFIAQRFVRGSINYLPALSWERSSEGAPQGSSRTALLAVTLLHYLGS